MLKTIVKKGDPVLEKKCHAVTKFDDKLACLLDDMTQTLAQSGGVGLAAPQIGICRRADRPGRLPVPARLLGGSDPSYEGEGQGTGSQRQPV